MDDKDIRSTLTILGVVLLILAFVLHDYPFEIILFLSGLITLVLSIVIRVDVRIIMR